MDWGPPGHAARAAASVAGAGAGTPGPPRWFTGPVDLDRLSTGERVVAVAGTALAVDLLFLPWHRFDLGIVVVPRTAVQWPFALLGVPALLLSAAMVAVVLAGAATDVATAAAVASGLSTRIR